MLALNTKTLDTIRIIPFFTNYGKELNLFERPKDNKLIQLTIRKVSILN